MGFWHTGYIDMYQPIGWDEGLFPTGPKPIIYRCQYCDKSFDDPGDLQHHRFEQHPVDRPVLYIQGMEVGSATVHITSQLSESDVHVEQASSAIANGRNINVEKLAALLASIENGIVSIELSNNDVDASFNVDIEIAEEEDIEGVERAFQSIVAGKRLDLRTVEEFISAAKRFHSASRYYDGVCEYLYGVMARERSPEVSLTHDQYLEKYNRATDLLNGFDRPLACSIRGLVAFHLNHFETACRVAVGTRISLASERFSRALHDGTFIDKISSPSAESASLDRLLSDWDTENLINLSIRPIQELASSLDELEMLLAAAAGDYDGLKLRLLLCYASKYSGDMKRAQRCARVLRNSPSVGDWAESFLTAL